MMVPKALEVEDSSIHQRMLESLTCRSLGFFLLELTELFGCTIGLGFGVSGLGV